jgi:hypothetical protein
VSTTYIPLAETLSDADLLKRQDELCLKVNSIEGSLYSLGAAVSECRKELNDIKREIHKRKAV